MKQSEELTKFYRAYNDWLDADAPRDNRYGFYKDIGLCGNLVSFYKNGELVIPSHADMQTLQVIRNEMRDQFLYAGLDAQYPFGERKYIRQRRDCSQHLDPNRIRWVKSHLETTVEEDFVNE